MQSVHYVFTDSNQIGYADKGAQPTEIVLRSLFLIFPRDVPGQIYPAIVNLDLDGITMTRHLRGETINGGNSYFFIVALLAKRKPDLKSFNRKL